MQFGRDADDTRCGGTGNFRGRANQREKTVDEEHVSKVVDSHVPIKTLDSLPVGIDTNTSVADNLAVFVKGGVRRTHGKA